MIANIKALALLGALAAGGLTTLGAPDTASAQLGYGYGPGFGSGITPAGGFGGINLSLGFGQQPGYGSGCSHGCKVPCRHVPVPPSCRFPAGPAFGGYPGPGYGLGGYPGGFGYGGSSYREYRSGYGFPGQGYGGFPGHGYGGFPGRGYGGFPRHCR